jgi:hypothetical protein
MNLSGRSGNVGLAAAAIGFAIAAFGLGVYQAWWTIAFALGGLAIYWAHARGAAAVPAIVGGLTITALLALGVTGLLLAAMGIFGRGRPDVAPGGGVPLLLLGLGVFAAAIVGLAVTMRYLRRATQDAVSGKDGAGRARSRDSHER